MAPAPARCRPGQFWAHTCEAVPPSRAALSRGSAGRPGCLAGRVGPEAAGLAQGVLFTRTTSRILETSSSGISGSERAGGVCDNPQARAERRQDSHVWASTPRREASEGAHFGVRYRRTCRALEERGWRRKLGRSLSCHPCHCIPCGWRSRPSPRVHPDRGQGRSGGHWVSDDGVSGRGRGHADGGKARYGPTGTRLLVSQFSSIATSLGRAHRPFQMIF